MLTPSIWGGVVKSATNADFMPMAWRLLYCEEHMGVGLPSSR